MSSATLDCVLNPVALDRPHVLMNKFPGPDDSDYKKVVEIISRFLEDMRTESPLEQAESWIRQKHYNEQRLKIQRLSGESLDIDRCYINLALLKTRQTDISVDNEASPSSPFTLNERLRVHTPPEDLRVELLKLFEPRNRNEEPPRRILIRGRAGVGKTTLCKKIVHDFVHRGMWQSLFKRLVWVPLRNLQSLSKNQYNLGGMLKTIFFELHPNGESLGDAMWQHIEGTKAQDTIFLLDGLDEVTEIITSTGHRPPHLGNEFLGELLDRPNVIITTRPHAAFPGDLRRLDLELDTIGFTPDQVNQYIEAIMPNDKDAIDAYLQKNRIMQSLVRIPIQLDALCYTWQESPRFSSSSNGALETMTAVYQAMTAELWRKDNDRILRYGPIGSIVPAEMDPSASPEYNDLGYLAFSGLCGNVIEFQPGQRDGLYRHILQDRQAKGIQSIFTIDETFARLSFLRTSGTSGELRHQSFHFIHLTFQEYFAAKHFVKAWKFDQTIRYTQLDGGQAAMRETREVSCHDFLQKHKYNARYDIMLRFVAGLLDAEGDSYITNFFEALEREPIDLLGPTHQRLIMHCVAELVQPNSTGLRTSLENQLSQWLEFECEVRGTSRFATETELSERVLILVLERASEKVKITILRVLGQRRNLSLHMVEFVGYWLQRQNASQQLRVEGLKMLAHEGGRLPTPILNVVMTWINDEDQKTREAAQCVLQVQKTWPEDIVTALIAQIESPNAHKRRTAVSLLTRRQMPENVLRSLTSWLERRDDTTRLIALAVLRDQSELPRDIVHAVAAQLNDQNEAIQLNVFEILNIQPTLPENILEHMVAWLENQDDDLEDKLGPETSRQARRRQSVEIFDNLLQAIFLRLKSQDKDTQKMAMRWLQLYPHDLSSSLCHDDFVQLMMSWVGVQDRAMRKFALQVLSCSGALPEDVVNAVVTHTLEQDKQLRQTACRILRNQPAFSANVSSVMCSWLWEADASLRLTALESLSCESTLPSGFLEAVLALLEDQDRSIRKSALFALGKVCRQRDISDNELRALVNRFHDNDVAVVKAALWALKKYWTRQTLPDNVVRDVVAQLNHRDMGVRITVLKIFQYVGFRDKGIRDEQTFSDQIIYAIAAQLEDQEETIRARTLMALGAFGSQHAFPEGILEAVLARIKDDSWRNRICALEALTNQEHDLQAEAVTRFQDTGESRDVRCAALRILEGLRPWHEKTLAGIKTGLYDRDQKVRRSAISALASRKELPEHILSAIVSLLSCEDKGIRDGVRRILQSQPGLSAGLVEVALQNLKLSELSFDLDMLAVLGAHANLPDAILSPGDLYPIWLTRCFEEHSYCYIENGRIHLELSEGFGKICLDGDPNRFREKICDRQKELGMPELSIPKTCREQ